MHFLTDRKFWSKFFSVPAIQIKGTCYSSWLFNILSNKQGNCLTSHFASCTGSLSSKQNFYPFAAALNIAKRISRGEVNGNPRPCTPKCLFCNSTGASWGNMKNLHRHTLLSVSFQDPKSAFKAGSSAQSLEGGLEGGLTAFAVSWREELFCKVTASLSKLRMSLMSKWRQNSVISMKPCGVCLFESGSLMSSLLQLWLLSAPVSVVAYWDFSSNCSWK